MSKKAVEDFVAAATKDKAIQADLREAGEGLLNVAKAHGFKFTRKEFGDYMKKRWKNKNDDGPDLCWGD